LTRLVKKVKNAGIAVKTEFQDRTKSVKKRILNIAKFAKNRADDTKEHVLILLSKLIPNSHW
jgi:hypothetical protein